jgi:hypothetical protein
MRFLRSSKPASPTPAGLAPGNKKTGISGTVYRSMFIWNLPSVACCPGASEWCLAHCYTADDREDVFTVQDWCDNWYWVEEFPQILATVVLSQLKAATGPVAVRLHSSGDFYSTSYIEFWRGIASSSPETRFWAYTRTWCIDELRPSLEDLRQLPNVQLFASWDDTMPSPPSDWRSSLVISNEAELQQTLQKTSAFGCPEQFEGGPACASCGLCVGPDPRGVIFVLH